MNTSVNVKGGISWIRNLPWQEILGLAVPLTFLLLMFFQFPFRERFEFDYDEGINAMKSLLLARGFSLYSEVWSDQPPLFTYLLTGWFRVFGLDINAGRVMVLLFSTLLLGSAFVVLQRTWGAWHALAGALLIFLLPYYNTLSVSVMIGLPALAFAVFSLLWVILWHQQRRSMWLWLSAIALSLSVHTKLFTGFLAPIFVVGILVDQQSKIKETFSWWRLLRPAVIWSLVFSILTFGLGFLLVGPANVNQLLEVHLAARYTQTYADFTEVHTILWYLEGSWPILLLAFTGSIFAVLEKKWFSLYLVAWAATGFLLLSVQQPVWYHHQLLITVPSAMLAGIAIGQAMRLIPRFINRRDFFSLRGLLAGLAIAGFALALVTRLPQTYYSFRLPAYLIEPIAPPPEREQPFLEGLTQYAAKTEWIVTDLPMYAFRAGLPVPPPIAVITGKRVATGALSEDEVIEIVKEYKPGQVFIGRFKFPKLEQFLRDDYRRNYFGGRKHLYVLGELRRNP